MTPDTNTKGMPMTSANGTRQGESGQPGDESLHRVQSEDEWDLWLEWLSEQPRRIYDNHALAAASWDECLRIYRGQATRLPAFADLDDDAEAQRKLVNLRSQEWAKRRLNEEKAAAEFVPPPTVHTLAEDLAEPREGEQHRISELSLVGGNTLVSATYKIGKTTLNMNLARSLATGEPFLGRFPILHPPTGRVAFWNYELMRSQFLAWAEAMGLTGAAAERMTALHLRGYRLPFWTPYVENWAVSWLASREVEILILDPLQRAKTGVGDINDNDAMNEFFEGVDRVKRRAGVQDVIISAHASDRYKMDEDQEHPLGASVIDGWPDVRWIYTKDKEGTRMLRANGRGIEHPASSVTHDSETSLLTFDGASRAEMRQERGVLSALRAVSENEGAGKAAVRGDMKGVHGTERDEHLRVAAQRGLIQVARGGSQKQAHWMTDAGRQWLANQDHRERLKASGT